MSSKNITEWKAEWNSKPMLSAVDKALVGAYRKIGNYTRRTAKNSIKTAPANVHSKPGDPPKGHNQRTEKQYRYKDWIFSAVDVKTIEVVVGAVLLARKDQIKVPKNLEHGGDTMFWNRVAGGGKRQVFPYVEARPHMAPALGKVVDKYLESFLKDSVKP